MKMKAIQEKWPHVSDQVELFFKFPHASLRSAKANHPTFLISQNCKLYKAHQHH